MKVVVPNAASSLNFKSGPACIRTKYVGRLHSV